MATHSHLTLEDRCTIASSLNQGLSFKETARIVGKDCGTVSREVRRHRIFERSGAYGRRFHDCARRADCRVEFLCGADTDCRKLKCAFCDKCPTLCKQYEQEVCPDREKPPYICNGCPKRARCTLEKALYKPKDAQSAYELVRTESRSGIALPEDEVERVDNIVSPLLKQGQSVHHILCNHAAEIMLSERTLYNYVDNSVFTAGNLDMPRKVRFRVRKSKHEGLKIDKACRIGRTWEDYNVFITSNPDIAVVQMDSVLGRKGGKLLLTIHFTSSSLMLAFLREHNTAQSVTDVFNSLYERLGGELFRLFIRMCGRKIA